jgi:hypothetical protein
LQYLLKYSNNQNNSENAKQIKGLCACFGLGAAAHRLAGWVCWAVAEKASQAPHIAQLGAACRDLAMAAWCCGCSGEGTLSAMGGQAMKTTWRRITGRLHFMVSRCEAGAATMRGKGGLTSPSMCCSKGGEDSVGRKLDRLQAPRTSEGLLRPASRRRQAALSSDLREKTDGAAELRLGTSNEETVS